MGYEIRPGHPSAAAAIGTTLHAGVAELLRLKMATGELTRWDVERATAKAGERFLDETKDGVLWDKTTPHSETALKQIEAMMHALTPLAHRIQATEIEHPLEHWFSPLGKLAIPVKVTGTIDARDIRRWLHDHKTGANLPVAHAQAGGYTALCRENGLTVDGFVLNFVKRVGVTKLNDQPAPVTIILDPDECLSAFWNTLKDLQRQYEAFEKTKDPWEFPANPMSRSCTPNYCNAHGTPWCKVGGSEVE